MGSSSSLATGRPGARLHEQEQLLQLRAHMHRCLAQAMVGLRCADLSNVADLTALQRALGPVNQALSIQRVKVALPGRDVRLFQGVREREAIAQLAAGGL